MFKLNRPLDRNSSVNLDDTLKTKTALNHLGYYQEPDWGMNEFPDEPLFKGIESFQRDHGLQVDGVMKPNGETASKLGDVLADGDTPSDDEENPCPKGTQPLRKGMCIPYTDICWHWTECVPNPYSLIIRG